MSLPIKPANSCAFDQISLGEVMLRLDPGEGRIRTARNFQVWEGGGEYNTSRGLRKCFGYKTAVVTAFVDNEVGHLVEVFNDNGATQAMAYPTPTAKRKETFMLFGAPTGTQGNVVNAGVNELILPNYKHAWANIRKLSDAPASVKHTSFKSQEYSV